MLRFPAPLYVRLKDLEFSIYSVAVQESYPSLSYTLGTLNAMHGAGLSSSRSAGLPSCTRDVLPNHTCRTFLVACSLLLCV